MSADRAAATTAPAWPYPRVLAHRGGGSLAPENTIAAISLGAARGQSAVEFDAMLARDGVPVLIHDPTLDRTTDGRGAVGRLSAAELARLDAGSWHSAHFAGEPVPALTRAL
ncbi:MAG TPA: glycerophosphodiester phosphodiesterase family protein, partial [Burkholderiaceae bacterium]